MDIRMHMYGNNAAELMFRNVRERQDRAKPAMDVIGHQMLESERRLFDTSGASAGVPWQPLDQHTIDRKESQGVAHPGKPLIREGELQRSLSTSSHPLNLYNVTKLYVLIGSLHEAFPFHRTGTRHMPRREPMIFTRIQVEHWAEILQDWIVNGDLHD